MKTVSVCALMMLVGCPVEAPGERDAGDAAGGGTANGGGGAAGGGSAANGGGGAAGGGAVDGGPTGFIFSGTPDAGIFLGSSAWQLLASDGGMGPTAAAIGSPCTRGNDCVALGPAAGCFSDGDAGFCTVACPAENDFCDGGFACVRGPQADGELFAICLPTCSVYSVCQALGVLAQCSGPFVTFQPGFSLATLACFPACSSDADCPGLLCNPLTHACADPNAYVGAQCASDDDCRNLGPGGSCLTNERIPANRYCTRACDPATVGCIAGYATLPDGGATRVQLKPCSSDPDCQLASSNTCNYFPALDSAFCSIRCVTDADCPTGTCDPASGDCREAQFWASDCAANENCAAGLCVSDFHRTGANCTAPCSRDTQCPNGSVCVFSPSAHDGTGTNFYLASADAGFCAPACNLDAGTCADPTTRCIAPVSAPEIDIAGSSLASSPFCWR